MEIIKGSKHIDADVFIAYDKFANQHLVVVAKATFNIPANDKMPKAKVPGVKLASDDIYCAEPGLSAPLYETDYVYRKNKCDVIFNAYAHTPNKEPQQKIIVSAQVAEMKRKVIEVTGDRHWTGPSLVAGVSKTQNFTKIPLHYGRAFGGMRKNGKSSSEWFDSFLDNPIGTGYSNYALDDLYGYALPNLGQCGVELKKPEDNKFKPIAFSVLARNTKYRGQFSGTYDQEWRDNIFPFLPKDFDEQYFQCAPLDQQINFPQGGELVTFENMMEYRPLVNFKLPRLNNIPLKILTKKYDVLKPDFVVDTLYFEPEEARFSVVWRANVKLSRSLNEIETVAIGAICKNWWEAKIGGSSTCGGCSKNQSTEVLPETDCDNQNSEIIGLHHE
jgi:hypothetical protein